jgi:hypothetical protein
MNNSQSDHARSGSSPKFNILWLAPLALAFISATAAAQDEDVLILRNGDRLTGEIRGLTRGDLSFNTDATGTIQVEWIYVAELTGSETFDIELANGVRFLGFLRAPDETGQLLIDVGRAEPVTIPFARVVSMTEIESTFRERLDMDLDFGYDFTKSSDVEILTLGFDMAYRTEVGISAMRFDTKRTDRGENGGLVDQASLDFDYMRLLDDRWLATGLVGFTSNSELEIDLRTTVGGGGGRIFSQSGQHRIAWLAGLTRIQEQIVDTDETTESTEGFGTLLIDWFPTEGNDFDLSSRWTVFPSLSQSGRYRSEFDLDLEWEIFDDITWGLSFYHDFDSASPSTGEASVDYGIVTTFGLEF